MPKTYPDTFKRIVADTYLNTDNTLVDVASMFGVSWGTVRVWAKQHDPEKYMQARARQLPTRKETEASLLRTQELLEANPNLKGKDVAELTGIARSTIYVWSASGLIDLDDQCEICGESTTTKYCLDCTGKGYDTYYRKYGMTIEEIRAMPEACEICGSTETLHVDHNHDTGKYRGVLCSGCNIGIGQLKENVKNLENAIKYIKQHR